MPSVGLAKDDINVRPVSAEVLSFHASKNRPYLRSVDPSPEEVSLLREHFSGIASMSVEAKALRNATVNMQNSPEVLRFSFSLKRIAMQRVRTGKETSSPMQRVRTG